MRADRVARAVVRLYPRVWRARYETELLALLDDSPAGWKTVGNLAGSCLAEWTRAFSVWLLDILRQPSPPKTWTPYLVWPVVGFVVGVPALVAANLVWSVVAIVLVRLGLQTSLGLLLWAPLLFWGLVVLSMYDAWNLKILPLGIVVPAIILAGGIWRCADLARSHGEWSLAGQLLSWDGPGASILMPIMLWLRRSVGGLSAMPPEWRSAGLTMLRMTGRADKDKKA